MGRVGVQHPRRKSPRLKSFDYASSNAVFFATSRTKDGKALFKQHEIATKFIECVKEAKTNLGHAVYVYCIMPDHFHLLCSPCESRVPITRLIELIKSKVTRLAWGYGFCGSIFQRSFYDHVVRKDEDLGQIAQYILNNPVRKGLVNEWRDYPYCGLLDPLPL